MTDDDLCPMSNLPPDQCALPCHRDERLPAGVAPEIRRGVEPSGVSHLLTVPSTEQHEPRDTRPRPVRPKRPKTACRWVGDDWFTREHLRDCDSHSCEGCKPCSEDHCALHGRCPSHVNPGVGIFTCPSCIGEFRDNVTEVETLTMLLAAEVEYASVGADPEHDVSEVVNLAGPFADPDGIDAARAAMHAAYEKRGWCDLPRHWLLMNDTHPVETLARLERDLRREYEQPPVDTVGQRPDVVLSRACDYLRGMLDGRFPQDEAFEKADSEIRRLRSILEGVLSDSRAPETGAPCPTCAADPTVDKPARLIKRHGHWCDDKDCKREHVSTITDKDGVIRPDTSRDEWVCPTNQAHKWSDEGYRGFVEGAYLAHADRLTSRQIADQYDIPTGTIRRWASTTKKDVDGVTVEVPPKLRSVGKTSAGVLLYRVSDVLALRARESGRTKETP